MSYMKKDLPEINLIDELLRHDPDIREKIDNGCLNRIKNEKEKSEKKTGVKCLICGTRAGKGVSMVFPVNIK